MAAAGRWIDRAPLPEDIVEHRLELLAARHLRERGEEVPEEFADMELKTTVVAMMAPAVLEQVRAAAEGPVILFKGLEVAQRYPDPEMRFFHDLDIIVPDAPAVQAQLLAAGFHEVGEPEVYEGIHHLRPLKLPGHPVLVEVHHEPKWLSRTRPPAAADLIADARPGRTGVDGVDALSPAAHALVLATHSWSNHPLWRLRDLLDIGLVAAETTPAEVAALARRWGMHRMWRTTLDAIDAMVAPRLRPTLPMRTWARNVRDVRGRTVAEYHLERWLAPFWGLPPRPALASVAANVRRDIRPDRDEPWADTARRITRSVSAAGTRKSVHDDA